MATVWNQGSSTGVFPEQKFLTKLLYITQLVRHNAMRTHWSDRRAFTHSHARAFC